MKAANVDAASRARHDKLAGLVLELDATEKEVARKAERNARTMARLDESVAALALRLEEKPAQLFEVAEESLARDAARLRREESVGVARIMGMKPLALSDGSNRHRPWFPDAAPASKPPTNAFGDEPHGAALARRVRSGEIVRGVRGGAVREGGEGGGGGGEGEEG